MLCSILISNFNKSQYIERCLNSLIEQTYKNTEIIFCDNNSTDNSIEIASKFKKIKIIKTKFPITQQLIRLMLLIMPFFIQKENLFFC